jgi:hypothetical protein
MGGVSALAYNRISHHTPRSRVSLVVFVTGGVIRRLCLINFGVGYNAVYFRLNFGFGKSTPDAGFELSFCP